MQCLKLGTVAAVLSLFAVVGGDVKAQVLSAHHRPSASAFDELYVSHQPVDEYATPNRGGGGCSYRFGVPTSPRYPGIGRPSGRSYEPVYSVPRLEFDARQPGQSRYAPTRQPANDPFYGAPVISGAAQTTDDSTSTTATTHPARAPCCIDRDRTLLPRGQQAHRSTGIRDNSGRPAVMPR